MLIANNITMQFGAKPLFENVSVKFGDGNRYGLIGANGAGKSTFMKILAGVLEPSAGNVALDSGERMAFLRQDQFAYEDVRVLDVVMMGHAEMWACMQEKDAIYANPEATEDDYMKAAELEGHFAEYDGDTGVQWTFEDPGYGWALITGYTSSTIITVTVLSAYPNQAVGVGNPTTRWALGSWGSVPGYPSHVCFFRNRLTFARARDRKLWFSVAADWR